MEDVLSREIKPPRIFNGGLSKCGACIWQGVPFYADADGRGRNTENGHRYPNTRAYDPFQPFCPHCGVPVKTGLPRY